MIIWIQLGVEGKAMPALWPRDSCNGVTRCMYWLTVSKGN